MDLPANGVSDRVFNSPLPVDWREGQGLKFRSVRIATTKVAGFFFYYYYFRISGDATFPIGYRRRK